MGAEEMAAAGKRLTESWSDGFGWPIQQVSLTELLKLYPQLRRSLWRRIRDAFLGFAYGWRGDVP